MNELLNEIVADLTIELSGDTSFNSDILTVKVKNAIREVVSARNYPKVYTDDDITNDLKNYYSQIRNIALYDYNQIGIEFETSHNENSTNRSYMERQKLFAGIVPFCKVF